MNTRNVKWDISKNTVVPLDIVEENSVYSNMSFKQESQVKKIEIAFQTAFSFKLVQYRAEY